MKLKIVFEVDVDPHVHDLVDTTKFSATHIAGLPMQPVKHAVTHEWVQDPPCHYCGSKDWDFDDYRRTTCCQSL